MLEYKTFPDTIFTPVTGGGNYQPEFSGRYVDALTLALSGEVTTSGANTQSTDGLYKLLGTVEIVQNEEGLIRIDGEDLRHLDAFAHGCYADLATPAAGTDTAFQLDVRIPFGMPWIPAGMIDATLNKVYVRGKFGLVTGIGSTCTTLDATVSNALRVGAECPSVIPANGYLRPKWRQRKIAIGSSSSNLEEIFRFEKDALVVGALVRQFDASADASPSGVDASRVDGLVKELRMQRQSLQGGTEIFRRRWGQLKNDTRKRFGIALAEQKTGVAWLPMQDDANKKIRNASFFQAGEALTLTIDTAQTAEPHITGVTPANGDLLIVTLLTYESVLSTAGQAALAQRKAMLKSASAAVPTAVMGF